ncbi:hypothetical protein ACVMGC_005333 [Bradyrhizobium barranii subsp. barranii]|uniref:hypothetical protein n=2 Tax=Bradyrhizobium TaxID=374 RepID=UPI001BA9AD07|nr:MULTISPECIES: hypothetical protein [Bradyrhizobium]WLB97128.1 hypothetical protein QIH92_47895 [Bradyrhizobium japonicum USDA 123]MBR1004614.1 hypothetical protein [Bradyrhizobium liaoningense]MCP1865250.1 hypothetical protein [Bradyrhizobium japonicum]MCP1895978.1 hypothetical protein [Bradyrhizobium japonicum]MCW2329362.1 hypothetical protein [Bradyrhizobium japonicum]
MDSMTHWTDAISGVLDHAERLDGDLEYFAEHYLKIRPKAGGVVPFKFNPVQRKLHAIIEEQLASTGMVRILVLKARQEGVSTYVAGRYYHKTIKKPGFLTAIVAHEKPAVRNLFGLVKRMHDLMPDDMRPVTGASNAEELKFSNIDSGYLVSVATEDGAGRSSTAQALHASEAAFWVNLKEQLAALMETVPDLPGTEIIIETTGNQWGDEFHQFWCKALAGENSFLAVFLPWSEDPTYRKAVPDDFVMSTEEKQLAELHKLDAEQIYWRRCKIADKGDINYFKREYPLTPDEAFLASSFDSFIPHELVLRARKSDHKGTGPLIVGVDPARFGADSTAIAWRRGSSIEKIEKRHGLDTMQVAGWVAQIMRDDKPAKVNIDVGGLGAGIYDRLVEQGYGGSFGSGLLNAVNFGSKPVEPPPLDDSGKPSGGPANRRAEMWSHLKTALEGSSFSLPDSDSLQTDICGPGYRYMSDGRLVLESKDDMKKRGMPSPDEGDAAALCFSEPGGAPVVANSNFNRPMVYPNAGIA